MGKKTEILKLQKSVLEGGDILCYNINKDLFYKTQDEAHKKALGNKDIAFWKVNVTKPNADSIHIDFIEELDNIYF